MTALALLPLLALMAYALSSIDEKLERICTFLERIEAKEAPSK